MKATTLGKLMVNEVLPEHLRSEDVSFSGDAGDVLLQRLATEDPDLYREVSNKLVQLGSEASYTEGVTIRLGDLTDPSNKPEMLKYINQQERIIDKSDATPAEKAEAKGLMYEEIQKGLIDDTYERAKKSDNPLAIQVLSKARGSPMQLAGVLSSPGNFKDAKGKALPLFVQHSYAEGLTPAEYYTATFGTRTGVISMKMATRDAGDVGKQFATAAMDLVVTSDDCDTLNGIPVATDDNDNIGTLLAKDVGTYKSGTPITAKMLETIKSNGYDKILVRSPITCQAEGGICKKCVGLRESGKFPNLRDHIGMQASSALAERIAQSALNVRHCLHYQTPVLCADWTARAIKDIKVGDMVMGCGLDGKMRPVRVVSVFDNGARECYRTSFIKNGCHDSADRLVLESTLEHGVRSTRRVSSQKDAVLNGVPRILPVGTVSKNFYALTPASFDDTGLQDEPLDLLLGCL
jgi:DNA-directed RNA polymerase subunit beta'